MLRLYISICVIFLYIFSGAVIKYIIIDLGKYLQATKAGTCCFHNGASCTGSTTTRTSGRSGGSGR